MQSLTIEKLQPGTACLERPLGHAPTAHRQKIPAHLFFTELSGAPSIVGSKPPNLADVDLLRAGHQAGKPHILQHALAQSCHHRLLSSGGHFGGSNRLQLKDTPLRPQRYTKGHNLGEAVRSTGRY